MLSNFEWICANFRLAFLAQLSTILSSRIVRAAFGIIYGWSAVGYDRLARTYDRVAWDMIG
ncbi:hypothetical protein H7992_20665 [Sporosarcina sp. resist]|uniref:hypothetical protein n=1 Tax=Sporosarcina sp. resist TaxID=2762563 RepID=UPI00164D162B|nr:hypothetical protein [Sporosarcina sp. resist]QNK87562.1 hypothetical protein H7992_20665 [Sporosarcina sp. resist]